MNKLQRLAERQCANYDKEMCLPIDAPCVLSAGCLRCPYFERSVLPAEQKLERDYWQARGTVYENTVICKRCGLAYTRKSNAQKYCEECRGDVTKRQKREQNRRYYNRHRD
ncbi:cysteine-rich VLP protein [Cytobacillus sp. FSL K6-0265]|uniref:cysteine-rich VLP protein n=1 Tax=Cytobacillus sp. FSL K6-0265 TaxID=2921448 RepID=UPI004046A0E8